MGKASSLAGLLLLVSTVPSMAQWDFRDTLSVPGVRVSSIDGTPDGALNVNIRGLNSLRGNNNPLLVVDGCIVGTSAMENLEAFFQYGENSYTNAFNLFSYLNPHDIEKVEILKNVSSTAIYGSKGADGVILVTTKSGSKDRISVDWISDIGVSMPGNNAVGTHPGLSHNHSVSVSGQSDRAGYSVSAFFKQVSPLSAGSPTGRGGLRTNFETRTNNILWFGLNSAMSIGSIDTPLTTAWYGKPSLTLGMREMPGMPSVESWSEDYDDKAKDYHTTNSLYLAVNPMAGMQWKTTVGLDFDNTTRYVWYGSKTPFGEEYNGAASIVTSKTLGYNAESRLSYHIYLGGNHRLEAVAAGIVEGNKDKFSTMNGNDFWTHSLRAKGLAMAGSKAVIRDFNYSFFHWGAYGKLGYNYAGVAGIDLLARASSAPRYDDGMPDIFPSAEAFWDIRNSILRDVQWLNVLSLHAGWGKSGKDVFVPYQMLSQFTTGDYPKVAFDVAHYYEALNKRASAEFNIGLETRAFDGKIWAEIGYYVKETSDDIRLYTFGGAGKNGIVWEEKPRETVYSQSASVGNSGIEWAIGGKPLSTGALSMTVEIDGCYNVNRIMSVGAPDRLGREVGSGVIANVNVLGYPAGSLYGYETDADGSFRDQTGDGKISPVDRVIIGTTQPKFFGGLKSRISWKSISLDAQLSGAAGHQVLNMNRMLQAGDTAVSAKYVENADYLRLQRLALSWKPDIKGRWKWLQGAVISLSAYNLFTATSYSGWNPDVNSFGISNLSTGFDYGSYPVAKTVLAGIQLNF